MKKKSLFITLTVVIVATAVAFVSCKKDNQNVMLNTPTRMSEKASMRHINDMCAYLREFKQKMMESTGEESLNLEDAAWHLACLANLEHCNINVEFDDVRFDTVYMQVNVTEDGIQMSDLRTAYEQMWPAIEKFQNNLGLDQQNLRFVNMSIDKNGRAGISMMTTFFSAEKLDHLWYFPSYNYADSICDYYFEVGLQYEWNTAAINWLTTVLNILESHYQSSIPGAICYFPTRYFDFNYYSWTDPYGSSFYGDSRLFAYYYGNDPDSNYYLTKDEMCYCLDSYIGMGYDYLSSNPGDYENELPVGWRIEGIRNRESKLLYHKLTVQYGRPSIVTPGPDPE